MRNYLRIPAISLISLMLLNQAYAQRRVRPGTCKAPPQFHVRHGLNSGQFQQEFNKYSGQLKYRLTDISVYRYGNRTRFAAIWEKKSGGAWVAKHGLTSSNYQQAFNTYTKQGYRLTDISGYDDGGTIRYAAIFEKKGGGAWVAKHGLDNNAYQIAFNEYSSKGYRPVLVDGFSYKNKPYFSVIFEKKGGGAWVAKHGLDSNAYQSAFNTYARQGYSLTHVSGYSVRGKPYFAAVWEKKNTPLRYSYHNMSGSNYQAKFTNLYYKGFQLKGISGYNSGNQPRFVGIWDSFGAKANTQKYIDDKIAAHMRKYKLPGMAIAITKGECLVYASGYGYARKSDKPAHANNLWRVASVSKPITSIAIMKLIEQRKFNLDSTVFGSGALLGTTYGTTPYPNGLTNMTVRHLLEHNSGWSNSGGDPMFMSFNNHKDIINFMIDNRGLTAAPGTRDEYLNFGYTVLGRIIEKVTGQSYQTYVRNSILKPAGISQMKIGASKENQKAANEVTYYPKSAYNLSPSLMDAHGGWIASPIDLARLMVHVDKGRRKRDILRRGTIDSMLDPTGINKGYAKGFISNSAGAGHNGEMNGTGAFWWQTKDGFTWAIVMNQRPDGDKGSFKAQSMMNNIVKTLKSWSAYDLF